MRRLLGDMLPCPTRHDELDRAARPQSIFACEMLKRRASGAFFSDVDDLRLGESRLVISLAARLSLLRNFVSHVVALGAKEQMIRPNAERVITTMAHDGVANHWAERQHPRHPMGTPWHPCAPVALAVAVPGDGACPDPACIGLGDVSPERIDANALEPLIATLDGAAPLSLAWPMTECDGALRADRCESWHSHNYTTRRHADDEDQA